MQIDVMPHLIHVEAFATDAARLILDEIRGAIEARGLCRLALSGGNTPRAIHKEMVRLGADVRWDRVQFTFGDERCVPPDHPDSNYLMARESLFDPLEVPEGNVFRMRGEEVPEQAALEYEEKLAAFATRCGEIRYVHDLILLGMGPDGHTASLFPGHPALEEQSRNIIAIDHSPKPPPRRITMTFPLLNAARHACFLAAGPDKRPIIEQIVAGAGTLPAARVRADRVSWVVDWK